MLTEDIVQTLCAHFDVSDGDNLKCVLTGQLAGLYSLYDDKLAEPFVGNYIPLAPSVSDQLERDEELSSELDVKTIEARYQQHLVARKPAYAYACARLIVHIYNRPSHRGKYLTQIVERAADALYCCRGRFNPDLVIHVIKHDIRRHHAGKLTPAAGQRLALEGAAYWSEYGHMTEAKDWVNIALRFEGTTRSASDEERARRTANLLRRQAQLVLHTAPENSILERKLFDASDLLPTGQLSFLTTSAILKSFRSFVTRERFGAAARELERIFEAVPTSFSEEGVKKFTPGLSEATAAEIYLYSGILMACIYDDVHRSQTRLRIALDLMERSGHRLPQFIWKYFQRLPFKRASDQQLVTNIGAHYASQFDLTPQLQEQFRGLKNWLTDGVPRTVRTRAPGRPDSGVLIVTALELEFRAVRHHLSEIQSVRHDEGNYYQIGYFAIRSQRTRVLLCQSGMGNVAAAQQTERAINFFKPSVVLFVGIAGGVKDVGLGDIVAASKVYGYEAGKAEQTFKSRSNFGQPTSRMIELAKEVARNDSWQQRISPPSQHVPRAFVGAIAAGEKVIASTGSGAYKLLKRNFGDSLAVEMEGLGILTATYAHGNVDSLVVRGISDLIDGKAKADASGAQERAAANAAAFAFEILFQTQKLASR